MIVSEHRGRLAFHHIDAYRLSSPEEGISAGLEDIIGAAGVSAVEWPDNVAKLLPNGCLRVTFLASGNAGRILTLAFPNAPRFQPFYEQCKRFLTGG
jgi:tRNA threonylcarbamoyladenosine biosynthesis protein TsaE